MTEPAGNLGDAARKILSKAGRGRRQGEASVLDAYREVADDDMRRHSQAVRFANGRLDVEVSSAPHKAEWQQFAVPGLLADLAEVLGSRRVKDIRFLPGGQHA